jgi:hypothetical protein
MCPGNGGNLGNISNVESVICRRYYPGDGTNPPLSALLFSVGYGRLRIFQGNVAVFDLSQLCKILLK